MRVALGAWVGRTDGAWGGRGWEMGWGEGWGADRAAWWGAFGSAAGRWGGCTAGGTRTHTRWPSSHRTFRHSHSHKCSRPSWRPPPPRWYDCPSYRSHTSPLYPTRERMPPSPPPQTHRTSTWGYKSRSDLRSGPRTHCRSPTRARRPYRCTLSDPPLPPGS